MLPLGLSLGSEILMEWFVCRGGRESREWTGMPALPALPTSCKATSPEDPGQDKPKHNERTSLGGALEE